VLVLLTNFILILTSVCTGVKPEGSLTEIRISMLSTFIHPSRGVCRETCTKFRRIDCQSFLSERNVSFDVHLYSSPQECACSRTQSHAHTCKCVYVHRFETWRNFSIVDTHRRVLKEFKIPLTTPRHPNIRYKSHIRVSVRIIHRHAACTYIYTNVYTHVDLT